MAFQFFLRYFFSKRAGSVIRTMARVCTVGTFIGVLALITVSSIMEGFNRSIRIKLLGVDPHLTAATTDGSGLTDVARLFGGRPQVEVNTYSKQDVILRTVEGHFSGAIAKGLGGEALYQFLNRTSKLRYKRGHAPELPRENIDLGMNEVYMGSDLARILNLFEGDEILIIPPESLLGPASEAPKFERMRLKGLVTTEFPEVDSKLILYELRSSARRFESRSAQENGLEFRFPNSGDAEEAIREMKNNFPGRDLKFETWSERNRALFLALRLEKFAMTSFLALSVLITCFSPIALLSMLIAQKRKEIGLLMAVGLSRKRVQKLFLILGLFLAGSGLFLGLIGGVVVSLLLAKFPIEILPDIYYDTVLPSVLDRGLIFYVMVFCAAVAFFAAYVPIKRFVLQSPSDNLRRQSLS